MWSYMGLHKSNVSWMTYLNSHHAVQDLLFDPHDVLLVKGATADLSTVTPALARLRESSSTGQVIFGPLLEHVTQVKFSKAVDEAIDALSAPGVIDVKGVDDVKAQQSYTKHQGMCAIIVALQTRSWSASVAWER